MELDNIIKITGYRETNPYRYPATGNNGGGYHQPEITGWVGETPFSLLYHNCGDFGRTLYLTMGRGKNARHIVTGDMGEREYMPARVLTILRAILRAANL